MKTLGESFPEEEAEKADLASRLGRGLAAMRSEKRRACARCGAAFVTIGRGRYCSHSCREMAYRQRKQERAG